MTAVYFDPEFDDEARRRELYAGAIFVSSPTDATAAFCAFARELIEEAFEGVDPEVAQSHMPVERYVAILSALKPTFIHHPQSKEYVQAIVTERGCDPETTYFDVPRLRTSTSDGYLTTGIAYAWHPHRDTWYSAPMQQLNFWMPVWAVEPGNAMAFHPGHFDVEVPNSSATYNYYEWNAKYRATASSNVGEDTRPLPGPTERLATGDPLILMTAVGGLIEFSGQHLHSSVPNNTGKTRFSIDFRTVHVSDIEAGVAAPNVDAACSGSSIRDFLSVADLSPIPERVVQLFDDGTQDRGDLLYVQNAEDRKFAVT